MIPEPNFPAKPEEFVGRKLQIEAFRRALQQGWKRAELRPSPFWEIGALERAACWSSVQ